MSGGQSSQELSFTSEETADQTQQESSLSSDQEKQEAAVDQEEQESSVSYQEEAVLGQEDQNGGPMSFKLRTPHPRKHLMMSKVT